MCWIDLCAGLPYYISHDCGKNLPDAAFQTNVDILHIQTKSIPIESAKSMSIFENFHSFLRCSFNILCKLVSGIDKDTALKIALEAVGDSIVLNRLVSTLLIFDVLRRRSLSSSAPSPSALKCAMKLRKAATAISNHFAS